MTPDEYQLLTHRTWREPGRISEYQAALLVCAAGLAGEAGEVLEHVKKHVAQGHPLDEHKLMEEMGDSRWYASELCTLLGRKLHEIDELNIGKLMARYPDEEGFSTDRSLNRQVQDLKAAKATIEGTANFMQAQRISDIVDQRHGPRPMVHESQARKHPVQDLVLYVVVIALILGAVYGLLLAVGVFK